MRGIRIGVLVADPGGTPLEVLLEQLRSAEHAGFQSAWIPSIFGMDAMTLAALGGRETQRLEIGTAVVPTHSRHPFHAAQQALSTQAACGGRFALGLGPSHKIVIEDMLGLSYAQPARHVEEYLRVVTDLVRTGKTSFQGKLYRVNASLAAACGSPPPVLIGALGPRMRRIAGAIADGTITWMTGRRTLAEQVGPGVRGAAREAGRPEPRIAAGFPVALTNDPARGRETASRLYAVYRTLPSYRAMLDAEGVEDPGELAIAGDAVAIERAIRALADAGVTDFQASLFAVGEDRKGSVQRTHELLGELARGEATPGEHS
jgi:F420-dependent oxidoreductase-like protein